MRFSNWIGDGKWYVERREPQAPEGFDPQPYGFRTWLEEIAGGQHVEIYCDLDGVLIDFDRAIQVLKQKCPPEVHQAALAHNAKSPIPLIYKAEEAGIHDAVEWWSTLPWMPDGKTLWSFIHPLGASILTARARDSGACGKGKMVWCQRELGLPPGKINITVRGGKTDWVQPALQKGVIPILIDDGMENIEPWNQAGGIGILHKSAAASIMRLREIMAGKIAA